MSDNYQVVNMLKTDTTVTVFHVSVERRVCFDALVNAVTPHVR